MHSDCSQRPACIAEVDSASLRRLKALRSTKAVVTTSGCLSQLPDEADVPMKRLSFHEEVGDDRKSLTSIVNAWHQEHVPLSVDESRHRSQWDDLFAMEGGVGAVIPHFKLGEKPLEPGFDGGGGLRLHVMELHGGDDVEEVEIIAGAAHKWERRSSTRHLSL